MSMLDRRLQVLIDAQRWERLTREAERRHVTVSTIVREAIDERYPDEAAARRGALDDVLAAVPMPVPDADDLHRELDELRSRRA